MKPCDMVRQFEMQNELGFGILKKPCTYYKASKSLIMPLPQCAQISSNNSLQIILQTIKGFKEQKNLIMYCNKYFAIFLEKNIV
jgi:hypothetical protein